MATTRTEDGTVLLDERTGRYWQLNTTAAYVLHHLLDGDPPDQIAGHLAEHYHLDPGQALTHVITLTAHLCDAHLVETT